MLHALSPNCRKLAQSSACLEGDQADSAEESHIARVNDSQGSWGAQVHDALLTLQKQDVCSLPRVLQELVKADAFLIDREACLQRLKQQIQAATGIPLVASMALLPLLLHSNVFVQLIEPPIH